MNFKISVICCINGFVLTILLFFCSYVGEKESNSSVLDSSQEGSDSVDSIAYKSALNSRFFDNIFFRSDTVVLYNHSLPKGSGIRPIGKLESLDHSRDIVVFERYIVADKSSLDTLAGIFMDLLEPPLDITACYDPHHAMVAYRNGRRVFFNICFS